MKELIIDIDNTGKVESLHMDEFSLGFLGKMEITRASEIKFNEKSQDWDIYIPFKSKLYKIIGGFEGYDVARDFEVRWLQECRKRGIHPMDYFAKKIAAVLKYNNHIHY